MIKLKKIIKEAFGDRKFGEPLPTFTGVMNDYQAGKLYTDKDKPPFKTEKQIEERFKKLIRYSNPEKGKKTVFIWPEGVFSGYSFKEILEFKYIISFIFKF